MKPVEIHPFVVSPNSCCKKANKRLKSHHLSSKNLTDRIQHNLKRNSKTNGFGKRPFIS